MGRSGDDFDLVACRLPLSRSLPPHTQLLSTTSMDDDAYPPGNFEPEVEPVEADAGEAYVSEIGSSSTAIRNGKRKREAPPPNATLTSEQIQAKLVR